MKLLILLLIIPNVYCGITNNFTVLPNNDIYIAHTKNSVIYKIKNNSTNPEVVVGQEGFHNTSDIRSSTKGINLTLYRPTSIIHSLTNNNIFFVNNNKIIKHLQTANPSYSTRTVIFNTTFNLITNITIDTSDNLYIANYSNNSDISTIYKFKENTVNNNYTSFGSKVIVNEKIKAINYVDDNINVITNKNYYEYSLDFEENNTETKEVTYKIESTNNTNKLEDIQDFVIDENFKIGYLAFQERLKWFYF